MFAGTGSPSLAAQKEFTHWPAGSSPVEIGKRVAERFVASGHLRISIISQEDLTSKIIDDLRNIKTQIAQTKSGQDRTHLLRREPPSRRVVRIADEREGPRPRRERRGEPLHRRHEGRRR